MDTILKSIWEGASGASLLEQVATVLGILGVWLMMRQRVETFPVSLVQVAIFGWVCFGGGLYSEAALQALFFAALVYGWVHWTRGEAGARPLPVRWLGKRERAVWLGVALAIWLAWGYAMSRVGAALPYADAFVFAFSVISQWLQARKVMENWIGWMIANGVAIAVFWFKEYYWFAVLYGIFGALAVGGFNAWRQSAAATPVEAEAS